MQLLKCANFILKHLKLYKIKSLFNMNQSSKMLFFAKNPSRIQRVVQMKIPGKQNKLNKIIQ